MGACTSCGAELFDYPADPDQYTHIWCHQCWLDDDAEILPDGRRIYISIRERQASEQPQQSEG